jgi:citrate lyase subunit beta/citryl-CoA lyase
MRSVLFTPGSDERKLGRALESDADAVVADLEDAVAPAEKAGARDTVRRCFGNGGSGPARLVRVNGFGTPYFEEDVAILGELDLDGVVLPMASPEGVAALAPAGLPIVAVVETAAGVRLAYEIASSPGVVALLLGAVDLGAEVGLEPRADGLELQYVRSKLVIDSIAAGIRAPVDCVHLAFGDEAGLEFQALLARSLGLRGKACIHPEQVAVVNRAFDSRPEEVAWARRVVDAASEGLADGRGVVVVEGAMVDAPVVARARWILEQSESHGR